MNTITSVCGGGMLKSAMAELHRAHMWAMVEIQVLMQCSAESFLELPTLAPAFPDLVQISLQCPPSSEEENKSSYLFLISSILSHYFESCWCSHHHSGGLKTKSHHPKYVCLVSNKYVAMGTWCCSSCCARCTSYLSLDCWGFFS